MFSGQWSNVSWTQLFWQESTPNTNMKNGLNSLGKLLTSIFNDGADAVTTFGNEMMNQGTIISLVSFVLALITSIGIVVMAVKGIKRVFGVFFMGIRNI
jgi:hypothetical protein